MALTSMIRILAFAFSAVHLGQSSVLIIPEQIHLSLHADGRSVVVTWATQEPTDSFVEFGTSPTELNMVSDATEETFLEEASESGRTMARYHAAMVDLTPDTVHFYRVGSSMALSNIFFFKTFPNYPESSWSPSIAMYGDLGLDNPRSLPFLERETQQGLYDAVFHIGDFGYMLEDNKGELGDNFMRLIEPIAAYAPYMTAPGNHESASNFSQYYGRFTMPEERKDRTDMFYSFNMGPVHFAVVDTEHYHFLSYGNTRGQVQYDWLVKDLQEANKPENRRLRPWVIVMGHRPMYCSNNLSDDCTNVNAKTRVGIPEYNVPGMENLLVEHRVDIALWAHEHNYERMYPIFNYTIVGGSHPDFPYTNPKGPVHITSGSAGMYGGHNPFTQNVPDFSAFRSRDYGYTVINVHNGSTIEFTQYSVETGRKDILDHIFVRKDSSQEWLTLDDYQEAIGSRSCDFFNPCTL